MTDQLALAGMPARLFSCTPSRLATYAQCPRRYRFAYLDRPTPRKGPPWAHNSVGASVHSALAHWWDLPLVRRTPEAAVRLLATGWLTDGYRDDAQSAAARDLAAGWVRRYVEELDPAVEPRAVERVVATRTRHLALSGRVDRLDERAGELVVVDYKTGRHLLGVDDVRGSQALALYAVAAGGTLRRPCRRVELHHLPSGEVHAWEHTAEALDRQVARAEAVAADIVGATARLVAGGDPDEAFPAVVSRSCSWCDHVRACPAGLAGLGTARPQLPWAGLAVEVDA